MYGAKGLSGNTWILQVTCENLVFQEIQASLLEKCLQETQESA